MIYPFDPEKARDGLIAELRSLAAKQGFSKVVVGISGGKDSTVTAAISARARCTGCAKIITKIHELFASGRNCDRIALLHYGGCSSMAERLSVEQDVVGSSPTSLP